jgi:hypothetical protein
MPLNDMPSRHIATECRKPAGIMVGEFSASLCQRGAANPAKPHKCKLNFKDIRSQLKYNKLIFSVSSKAKGP